MKIRLLGCWLMIAAVCFLATGCGGGDSETKAGGSSSRQAAGKTLRINLAAEPKSLDPTFVTVIPDNKALHPLMEGLIVLDGDAMPTPGVAMEWTHDESHRVWTFKLRPDAKWHNGDPVVAGDFVYSVQRLLTKNVAAPYASLVMPFIEGGEAYYEAGGLNSNATLKGVIAEDDHTLVYRLTRPVPNFPVVTYFACWLPLNRKAVEAGGPGWANAPKTFVGNGAFRMTAYNAGDRIVTEKADTYWV
ncbi:hypothetical protein GC173_11880 [bacterium]|nr:hypothetical protein [bacterium]